MNPKLPQHIVFFDGVCNLCNSAVQFIIRRDTKDRFRFASLQWDVAREVLGDRVPKHGEYETIYYYENGKIYSRSDAVLRIARLLRFPWPLFYSFIIIPPFIRNFVYAVISRNRYKWFGKKDQCMIPSPGLKNKFLVSSL